MGDLLFKTFLELRKLKQNKIIKKKTQLLNELLKFS